MIIEYRHQGSIGIRASTGIEVSITSSDGTTISEDVTYLDGRVPESLIEELKDLLEVLEEQNELIKPI